MVGVALITMTGIGTSLYNTGLDKSNNKQLVLATTEANNSAKELLLAKRTNKGKDKKVTITRGGELKLVAMSLVKEALSKRMKEKGNYELTTQNKRDMINYMLDHYKVNLESTQTVYSSVLGEIVEVNVEPGLNILSGTKRTNRIHYTLPLRYLIIEAKYDMQKA